MGLFASLSKVVSGVAPILGTVLAGPLGGVGGYLLSTFLKTSDKPEEMEKYIAENPQAMDLVKKAEQDNMVLLQKILSEQEVALAQEDTKQMSTINETMRAELANEDRFKTYWRPLFGYAVSLVWVTESLGMIGIIGYLAVTNHPGTLDTLKVMISLIEVLSIGLGIALAMLGVNMKQRSNDKKGLIDEKSIVGTIIDKFRK